MNQNFKRKQQSFIKNARSTHAQYNRDISRLIFFLKLKYCCCNKNNFFYFIFFISVSLQTIGQLLKSYYNLGIVFAICNRRIFILQTEKSHANNWIITNLSLFGRRSDSMARDFLWCNGLVYGQKKNEINIKKW